MFSKSTRELGFTLLELLVVIAVISVLAAISIAQYQAYKTSAYDSVAKSDLKNALSAAENYYLENDTFSADPDDLLTNGFRFSENVCFTKFKIDNDGDVLPGGLILHIHIRHTGSDNTWHTEYPDDGGVVEHRNEQSCL